MSVRPSIGPPPPPEVYICWAQRSLLRQGFLPGLEIDGADSALYRDAIKAFQTENGLPSHGLMDSTTQDRLIKLNHVDVDYTEWVQRALLSPGLLKPARSVAAVMSMLSQAHLHAGQGDFCTSPPATDSNSWRRAA